MKKSNGQINLIKDSGKTHKMPPDAPHGAPKPHAKAVSQAKSSMTIMKGNKNCGKNC